MAIINSGYRSGLNKKALNELYNINRDCGWWGRLLKDIIRDRQLYILLLPTVLFFLIFVYKPFYGLQVAFKDFRLFIGIQESSWVGFKHFIDFFNGPYFLRTIKNTFIISLYSVTFGFSAPIVLALLLNEVKNIYFKSTIQTLTFIPHFISIVVVAGLVTNFLSPVNGLVNIVISKLGGDKIYFLTKPQYFRLIFTFMNIWKDAGFSAIIYLAALAGIDIQLYEASYLDGANKLKQLCHITIPGILPTVMILLILRIGTLFNVGYEAIILLYQPSTYETADVINTFVYRAGITEGRYDIATAAGIFNGVAALILVMISNYLSKKFTKHGLW